MIDKKQKGITLIALIVTIIVLLILAGITITLLTQNGLFENAKLAAQKTKEAQEKENGILSNYENKINGYFNGEDKKITDNTPPKIEKIEGKVGEITFSATDEETNIKGYAITKDENTPIDFTNWNGDSITLNVDNNTILYLWIKNEANLITNKKFQIHSHQGENTTKGGCYTEPVYHSHQGTSSKGGGCYSVKQTETTWEIVNFYKATAASGITYGDNGGSIATYYKDASYDEPIYTVRVKMLKSGMWSGRILGLYNNISNANSVVNAVKKGEKVTTYYAFNINDSFASSVESTPSYVVYQPKEVTTYSLGCGKDENTIDYYNTTCGLEDGELVVY